MSGIAVEADCPSCDLIERHPLDVVRRAEVLTCHGCGHPYTAEPVCRRGFVGRPTDPEMPSRSAKPDRKPAQKWVLVLRVVARSNIAPCS